MAGLQIEVGPAVEPILLVDMKNYLKVDYSDDDNLISGMITAARELVESFTSRSLVNKQYLQTLDSFPYFTDTVMSQQAYSSSPLPRYSTTLWNYSQMIKLFVAPVVKVSRIVYLGTDAQYHTMQPGSTPWRPQTLYAAGTVALDGNGNLQQAVAPGGTSDVQPPNTIATGVSGSQGSAVAWSLQVNGITTEATGLQWQNIGPATLNPLAPGSVSSNTFFLDQVGEPARLFPGPAGSFWPPVMYVPDAVEIHYTAGYGDAIPLGSPVVLNPPVPSPAGHYTSCVTAMQQLVAGWYENREAVSPLSLKEMPNHVKALLWSARILDMQPTRG